MSPLSSTVSKARVLNFEEARHTVEQHAAGVSSVIRVVQRKDELGGDDLLRAM